MQPISCGPVSCWLCCVCPQASWQVRQHDAPLVTPAADPDPDAYRSLSAPLDQLNMGDIQLPAGVLSLTRCVQVPRQDSPTWPIWPKP